MYWKVSLKGETMKPSSKVKGPSTRSKRRLPVLIMTYRAVVARCWLTITALRAVSARLRMFPGVPNGLQDRQYEAGAQP